MVAQLTPMHHRRRPAWRAGCRKLSCNADDDYSSLASGCLSRPTVCMRATFLIRKCTQKFRAPQQVLWYENTIHSPGMLTENSADE